MNKLVMLGFPASGKSTFLAALWHVVQDKDVVGALNLQQLDGNREYIDALYQSWLRCESVQRTLSTTHEKIAMQLQNLQTGITAQILFPDLAGEVFEDHWRERRWMQDYLEQVKGASAMILFLHANCKYHAHQISESTPLLDEDEADANGVASEGTDGRVYSREDACLQVKLVEMLQYHLLKLTEQLPIKVAIVISAWDWIERISRAEGSEVTPRQFISQHVPLLDQFIKANPERLHCNMWGISAQGGDYEAEDREQLLREDMSSNRIKVISSDGCEVASIHDITAPVRWAIF